MCVCASKLCHFDKRWVPSVPCHTVVWPWRKWAFRSTRVLADLRPACGSSRVLDGVEGLCDSVYRMDSGLGDRLWAQGRNVSTQGSIIFGFERGSTRA